MNHKLRKFLIYFNSENAYWRPIEHNDWRVESAIGPFFGMHLKDRLFDNHYQNFDDQGIPTVMYEGKRLYNYTTVCSYALANWELYLETGEEKYTEPLWNAAKFLKENHEVTEYGGVVFRYKGVLSAMNQGEAMSVLARCYELKPDPEYVEFAHQIMKPYRVPVAENGVLGKFSELEEVYWYEEKGVLPGKHILNGMCYSLMGLYDISQSITESNEASLLWKEGIEYLKQALHLYDKGDWSWYWISEEPPHYIASMMYHNLHIIQLTRLYQITKEPILKLYAERFDQYRKSLKNRVNAGIELYRGKKRL